MLIDYEYSGKSKNLIVSWLNESGNIKLTYHPWPNPTKYVATSDDDPDRHGRYVTWDGRSVKIVYTRHPDKYSVFNFLDSLPEADQDNLFRFQDPNVFFLDIENEVTDSKPDPKGAKNRVQTVSIVNKDKVLVLGTAPLSAVDQDGVAKDINTHVARFGRQYSVKYIKYDSERDMLLNLFKAMIPKMSVLTGWNFVGYDWVYLVNRARNIGLSPEMASFTGTLREPWKFGDQAELPAHRVVVDYMELYQKWDTKIKIKESSSLDYVSEKILEVKKVSYHGNLTQLYRDDYRKFVFYNAVDSILVQLIHEKMRYLDVMLGIATLSRIRMQDAFSTLAVTEGYLRRDMREKRNVVFCRTEDKGEDEVESFVKGGWVKDPVRGMSTWCCCYDFASLYPSTMREFNISADSYKGQKVKGRDVAIFHGHEVPVDPTDIITINGAVFRNEKGVVTNLLEKIYVDRKKFKKIALTAKDEMRTMERELAELEKII